MKLETGSSYEKKKEELADRIRVGDINSLEAQAENHACYFCRKHIDDKMIVLIDVQDKKNETEERYFLHRSCYEDAKVFPFLN